MWTGHGAGNSQGSALEELQENSVKQKVFLLSLGDKYWGGKDFENM